MATDHKLPETDEGNVAVAKSPLSALSDQDHFFEKIPPIKTFDNRVLFIILK